jgi:MoaA/NifB/PqqE/SkfB family radical SAM enzyme
MRHPFGEGLQVTPVDQLTYDPAATIDQPYNVAAKVLAQDPCLPDLVYCEPDKKPLPCGPGKDSVESFDQDSSSQQDPVRFAWLEITGNCQEKCGHCYADSSPEGTNGTMTTEDWKNTIDQLSGVGTNMVQFIGGEPTLHQDLVELMNHALGKGMQVEVFSNLVHVRPEHWEAFKRPGVQLATSYYSTNPATHREITKANTHNPIRKNIQKATAAGIPLRAGVIGVQPDQDIQGAIAELVELGVDPQRIGVDYLRQVGRGVRDEVTPETTSQLCGNCADGVVAIMPDGRVQPCVFSRQSEFTIGSVRDDSVSGILGSERLVTIRGLLRSVFSERRMACSPESCSPDDTCDPQLCAPHEPGPPMCTPDRPRHMRNDGQDVITDGPCYPDDLCGPALPKPTPPKCAPDQYCQPDCNPSTRCQPDCRPSNNSLEVRSTSVLTDERITVRGVAFARHTLRRACSPDSCAPDDVCNPDLKEPTPQPCLPDDLCGPNVCNPRRPQAATRVENNFL